MNHIVALLVVTSLAGCATTSVKEYQAPDGSTIKTVKCVSDPQKCFVQASQSCPAGGTYRVVSSESHAGGILADLIPGPATWYGMTYACGVSDGKMPDFKFQGQVYTPPPPDTVIKIQNDSRPRSTNTNCTTYGNTTNCSSY